jgi:hypothetical protein
MPAYQTTPTVTTFTPQVGTPNRGTNERELDTFNQQLRSSPLYQQFMQSRGLRTDGRVRLSRKQQSDLERAMGRAGFPIPKGMHIDQGGNLNQKNRLVRNAAITAGLAAGTIATLGATGVIGGGVLGGFTGGGAATAGGVLPSTALAPLAPYAATVPMAATGATTAGAAAAAASNAALGIGAWGGGAGGAGLGASAAPVIGAGTTAASAPAAELLEVGTGSGLGGPAAAHTTRAGMAGLSTAGWIDIGGKGLDAGMQYFGQKGANAASDRAAELQRQTSQDLIAVERDKMAEAKRQADLKQAAEERNYKIAQEERLENLKRVEEIERQRDPARLAREQAYRAYMMKYYGYDTGPSVARTPRTIADGTTPADLATASGGASGGTLSGLTKYGGDVTPAPAPTAPVSTDPFMQGWTLQSQDMPYRRSIQRGEEAQP